MRTTTHRTWMIYGANGYTGELIAREAVERGERPVLSGRNIDKIQPLAAELGLEARAFALEDSQEAAKHLHGISLVMHCAGPFSVTARPMMEACLNAGAHYLDITGEIAIFEMAQTLDYRARQAGIVICPGVGFDVIPTDCLAAVLKQQMPEATHLALGFDTRSTLSPGTAKTSVESLAMPCKVRRKGEIISVPMGHQVRRIDFGNGVKQAMAIPWGDVSTAYHTTGIPNIEVYIPAHQGLILGARVSRFIQPVFRLPSVQKGVQALLARFIKGPDGTRRADLPTYVWGEARNAHGQVLTARVRTANVYSLTVSGALAVAGHLMRSQPEGGTYTPSKLVGADLVTQLPGSGPIEIA